MAIIELITNNQSVIKQTQLNYEYFQYIVDTYLNKIDYNIQKCEPWLKYNRTPIIRVFDCFVCRVSPINNPFKESTLSKYLSTEKLSAISSSYHRKKYANSITYRIREYSRLFAAEVLASRDNQIYFKDIEVDTVTVYAKMLLQINEV